MLAAAVCRACVVSGGSAAMQWIVGRGVYAVCELNCSMYCGTAGRRTHTAALQSQADQTSMRLHRIMKFWFNC